MNIYQRFRSSRPNVYWLLCNVELRVPLSLAFTLVVESVETMELVLNLAWALLAAFMVCLWMRFAPRTGASSRMQLVALAVLLLILLPVISVTDDLQAAQNFAETDSLSRRDHCYSTQHSVLTPVAALPLQEVAGLSFGELSHAIPGNPHAPVSGRPELAPIKNRPPPVA